MLYLILSAVLISGQSGDELLNQVAGRYSGASGIQWNMQSQVYSPVFEETETTPVSFEFNPPDTFCFRSPQEEVIGIADTVWVMSKRHHQIQKKLSAAYVMPTDIIINWNGRYNLESYKISGDLTEFELAGKDGVTPAKVKLTAGKNYRIKSIFYKDSSGNDVTLKIKKEKLARSGGIVLFYLSVPGGFRLLDLTE